MSLGVATSLNTGLIVIDLQEKLVPLVERSAEMLFAVQKLWKGCKVLSLPIVLTEQIRLGQTVTPVLKLHGPNTHIWSKSSFSCLQDPDLRNHILGLNVDQWILCGIEAHICIFQTAKDLILEKKKVIVINDAMSSRSIFDYSTAIAEMRDLGVRISSVELVLFELLKDAKSPYFKDILSVIKEQQLLTCT